MRVKLPENFGGISYEGEAVELDADDDGCVDVGEGVGQALLAHGGTLAPAVEEENAKVDAEEAAHDRQRDLIQAKRQKGR